MFSDKDTEYMQRAIELAKRGWGHVSPNPPVGCVIIDSGGNLVGEGWHEKFGGLHAEPNSLNAAGEKAHRGTAYVTLMPCNHFGKTPPCTRVLIEAGVKRVVVAVDDPNPEASGGRKTLEEAGIIVQTGLLEKISSRVLGGFLKFIREGLPQLTLKYAMTLDGKIATSQGDSKWISGEYSRSVVQRLRSEHDAVMVGSGTVLADDPQLNVRNEKDSQPLRLVVDSKLRTPVHSKLFSTHGGQVVILAGINADEIVEQKLIAAGAKIHRIEMKGQTIDLHAGLHLVAEEYGVRRILCEGGGGLAGALLRDRLVDMVNVFIAPKILGCGGISPVEGGNIEKMAGALPVTDFTFRQSGDDIYLEGWLNQ